MAKNSKKSPRKPKIARSTNRTVAMPKYSENRRAKNKNTTDARLILDNSADAILVATDHVTEFFGPVARSFEADAGYGFQHFNQEGFVHPDGALRLSNESLALMGLQIAEVLSQRAAHKGSKAFEAQMGEGGSPTDAQKTIDMFRRFLNERPAAIRKDSKSEIYTSVLNELGIDNVETVTKKKVENTAKKTSKKKTAKSAEVKETADSST